MNPCKGLNLASSLRALTLAVATVVGTTAAADTIYLKNGAFIDGMVRFRTETFIELEIGDIGKIQIPLEDIFVIEKNKRTGGEAFKNYVAGKGKIEAITTDKKTDPEGDDEDSDTDSDPLDRPDEGDTADDGDLDEGAIVELLTEDEEIEPALKDRIEHLVQDMKRDQARYRTRAERHLKAIGRPSIPFLLPLARNKKDLVRISTMRLFYAFGDDRVIPICIENLVDVNEYVRNYANKTLVRITGENFGFQSTASPRRRELAQEKWKKWWKDELAELAAARRESGSGL